MVGYLEVIVVVDCLDFGVGEGDFGVYGCWDGKFYGV